MDQFCETYDGGHQRRYLEKGSVVKEGVDRILLRCRFFMDMLIEKGAYQGHGDEVEGLPGELHVEGEGDDEDDSQEAEETEIVAWMVELA